jgi:predicted MFS family arabinose efflux permease
MIRTTLQFEAPARRVLWCGGVLVALSMGLRQSFGLLMEPLTTTLAIDRSTFSLAIAWQNLMLAFPLVGWLTERLGFRWVGLVGAGLYVVGLWQASSVVASGEFFWWFGLDLGLALSMTTYVVVLGAVGQVVSPSQRGAAFGLITAAGSFGMFALVPLTQGVISVLDWRGSLAAQSVLALLMFGLAWQLPGRGLGHRDPVVTPDQETLPLWETVRGALRDSSY